MIGTTEAVRREVVVDVPPERAFEIFTAEMTSWWPAGHHIGSAPIAEIVIEPRAGGRWYEKGADGSEHPWGRVIAYEPPSRLVLAWQLTREFVYDPHYETTVEVRFEETVDGTRVHFEHRDLERMGADAVEMLEGMDGGWGMLLGLFKDRAEQS